MSDPVPGLFTLVLHTHLPWLAHHGRWPVGEEWLYQSWSAAYLPLMRVLRTLADEDRHHLVTLGMTPVVTAQLDDPYSLTGMHHWLANWRLRAHEATTLQEPLRQFGIREVSEADRELDEFTTLWRHGGSPLLRELIDADAIELLGGPLSHPFQPLLNPRLREFALREGLADANQRLAHTPTGIWAPECAYAPGMEFDYAAAGVGHFMVDGPSLHGDTALGRPVGDSDVIAFGRDLQVSYRVWSPKSGYPGHAAYRDFHTYDHVTGLKPARVTGRNVPSDAKAPYDPVRAEHAVDGHVADFVDVVRRRLVTESERIGRPAHVIAAFDTELFGHWWYEGPVWLETGVACAARGRHPGRHAVRRGCRWVHRPSGRIAAQLLGFRQGLVGVVGREGRRPRTAEHRSRRHRTEYRGQGIRAERVGGRAGRSRHRRRPDPAGDTADGVERLAVHGEQGLRGRLRPVPRSSARARHPRDRGRACDGPS